MMIDGFDKFQNYATNQIYGIGHKTDLRLLQEKFGIMTGRSGYYLITKYIVGSRGASQLGGIF